MTTLEKVKQLVRELPVEERREVLIEALNSIAEEEPAEPLHNILEFEGVGAHLYDGGDAQDDIDVMRDEWNTPL